MLAKMHRKHTYADFKMQVDFLRSRDPLFSISTDIIVGFPGETLEMFDRTYRAFEECVFDFAYIARYSPRSQTRASQLYLDDIDPQEKARRWDILNTKLKKCITLRAQQMIGRSEQILVTSISRHGDIVGRTRNFKEVFLPADPSIVSGDLVDVRIERLE